MSNDMYIKIMLNNINDLLKYYKNLSESPAKKQQLTIIERKLSDLLSFIGSNKDSIVNMDIINDIMKCLYHTGSLRVLMSCGIELMSSSPTLCKTPRLQDFHWARQDFH